MTLAFDSRPARTAIPTDSAAASGRRWARAVPALVSGVVTAVVGSIGVTRPALGWDEHASWSAATRTPGQIAHLAAHIDGVIAPYYLFLHYWIAAFGDSLLSMRLPSLLAVSVGVALAGELGRRLFGAGTGLAAGLMLATIPQLSRFAQDVRAYGIAFGLSVAATLALFLVLEKPGRWRWLGYGAAVTALGYAHLFGLLVLAGHFVVVLLRGRDRLPRWLAVTGPAVLLTAPMIWLGLTEHGTQLEWIGPVTTHTVLGAPGLIFGAPAAGLFLIGLAFCAPGGPPDVLRTGWGLAALAVFPPVILLAVSTVTSPVWVPRYVLAVTVPTALLAALALRGRRARTVLALAVLAALSVETHRSIRGPAAHGGMDFRRAAAVVAAGQRPGDGMVFGRIGTWSLRAGMEYEFRDRPHPRDLLLVRSAAENGGLDGRECPSLACFDTDRVWYVGARHSDTDPLGDAGIKLRAKLQSGYRLTGLWVLPLGTVALYQRQN